MNRLVEFENVTKSYSGKTVLENINLKIEAGKIIGLVAPNGTGKTTLIKLIVGINAPDSGKITVNGKSGAETRKDISYMSDSMVFEGYQKIKTAIKFYERYYSDFDSAKCKKFLKRMKIDLNSRLSNISKGQAEMVQLFLAISRNVPLYIFDEPLAHIDPVNRDYILTTIIKEFREDATVLIATQLLMDVESIIDEVIMLKGTGVACQKSVDEIRDETGKSLTEYFKQMFREDILGGDQDE